MTTTTAAAAKTAAALNDNHRRDESSTLEESLLQERKIAILTDELQGQFARNFKHIGTTKNTGQIATT
jgi:hypothetical protein